MDQVTTTLPVETDGDAALEGLVWLGPACRAMPYFLQWGCFAASWVKGRAAKLSRREL